MPSKSSVRVLHYMDAIDESAGGVVRCVLDLCNVLSQGGSEVTLATYSTKDVPQEWAERPGAPRVIDMRAEPDEFQTALATADVVHLHTIWDRHNLPIARSLRRRSVPYIVSLHGMLDDWCVNSKFLKKRLYMWLAGRRLLEGAYRVHCTAEGERAQAAKWYPGGESVVLPLLLDMPDPNTLPGAKLAQDAYPTLNTSDSKVLFVGRLHPIKGLEILIEAMAIAVERGTEMRLFLAGPGDEAYIQQLKQLASQHRIDDRVEFVGSVSGDTKFSLYQACDLFAHPSYHENFGLVLPESLVCSTPVLTSRCVNIWPQLLEAGGTIVDHPPESFADGLVELLADRQSLAERGRQGRDYVLKWLDPALVAQQYQQLYSDAAAS